MGLHLVNLLCLVSLDGRSVEDRVAVLAHVQIFVLVDTHSNKDSVELELEVGVPFKTVCERGRRVV